MDNVERIYDLPYGSIEAHIKKLYSVLEEVNNPMFVTIRGQKYMVARQGTVYGVVTPDMASYAVSNGKTNNFIMTEDYRYDFIDREYMKGIYKRPLEGDGCDCLSVVTDPKTLEKQVKIGRTLDTIGYAHVYNSPHSSIDAFLHYIFEKTPDIMQFVDKKKEKTYVLSNSEEKTYWQVLRFIGINYPNILKNYSYEELNSLISGFMLKKRDYDELISLYTNTNQVKNDLDESIRLYKSF